MTEQPQPESDATVVSVVDFLARRVDAMRRELLEHLGSGHHQGRTEMDASDLALDLDLARAKARLAAHRLEFLRRATAYDQKKVI